MKNIIAALGRAPKRSGIVVAILAAIIVPAALHAWGPDRPTYTMDHPADHVTFNSITDNPAQGDERDFVQIKDSTASNSSYDDDIALQPGHTYDVYVYYHNDASSSLNDAAHNYAGIAKDAYMKVEMPSTVSASQPARFQATVGASNASPTSVWSNATGTAKGTYALSYVSNSAVIHNNGASNGSKLPDNLYTSGTPLGYNKLDGTVPGCTQYSGYVTYQVKVNQPNFTVNKTVRIDGQGSYVKNITANPGQTLDYEIEYNNTGTTTQHNVVVQDKLPAGITYIPGSTQLANPNTGGKWVDQTSNDIVSNGVSIGTYGPASNAYVKFKAKVADNDKLPKCGENSLVNTATAKTDNGDKSDTATVVATRKCETPPPTPVYTCDALTVSKLSDTQFKFATGYTVKNATFKGVTYVVTNAHGGEVYRGSDATYTQTTPGTYTVKAYVTVTVNGSDKTVTSDACAKQFTVPTPPPVKPETIQVCRLSDYKVVTINKDDFDASKYTKDLSQCQNVTVCDTSTHSTKTVPQGEATTPPYTTDLSKCAVTPVAPVTPVTPTPPAPVTELPHTGTSGTILSVIGAGSLVTAVSYYVASRRGA